MPIHLTSLLGVNWDIFVLIAPHNSIFHYLGSSQRLWLQLRAEFIHPLALPNRHSPTPFPELKSVALSHLLAPHLVLSELTTRRSVTTPGTELCTSATVAAQQHTAVTSPCTPCEGHQKATAAPATLPKLTAAALPPGTCSELDGKYFKWETSVLQVTWHRLSCSIDCPT